MTGATALFVAFMFGAINALLVAALIEHYTGRRRAVRLGRKLLDLCCDDDATAWAELRNIEEMNAEDTTRLKSAMEAEYASRGGFEFKRCVITNDRIAP